MTQERGSIELPMLVFLGVVSTLIAAANFVGVADDGASRLVLYAAAIGIAWRVYKRIIRPLVEIPGRLTRIEKHLGIEPEQQPAKP